jgi:ParB-like chromosome segregation protein Spo0J
MLNWNCQTPDGAAPARRDEVHSAMLRAALPYRVAIRPLGFFRPSEAVDHEAVHLLASMITAAGAWTRPLPVHGETGIIMDGNHRAAAAALLGLRRLPCVLLSYQDPRVSVTDWRSGAPFSVEAIYRAILAERGLLAYKTTRHDFAPVLPETDIELAMLR